MFESIECGVQNDRYNKFICIGKKNFFKLFEVFVTQRSQWITIFK